MNIFVSNISFKLDQDALKEVFQNFGEVSSCKIMMDKFSGRSKGFGFVEMPNDTEGQNAIDGLNGKEVDGRSLTVAVARPREAGNDRRSGGGNNNGGGRRERW